VTQQRPEPILANAEQPPSQRPPKHSAREVVSTPIGDDCAACGRHHGSQGEELWCMRSELARLRELAARFEPVVPTPASCSYQHVHDLIEAVPADLEYWAERGSCPTLYFDSLQDAAPESWAASETRVSDPVLESAHDRPHDAPGRPEAPEGGEPLPDPDEPV